jgi:hypothetical protein
MDTIVQQENRRPAGLSTTQLVFCRTPTPESQCAILAYSARGMPGTANRSGTLTRTICRGVEKCSRVGLRPTNRFGNSPNRTGNLWG